MPPSFTALGAKKLLNACLSDAMSLAKLEVFRVLQRWDGLLKSPYKYNAYSGLVGKVETQSKVHEGTDLEERASVTILWPSFQTRP